MPFKDSEGDEVMLISELYLCSQGEGLLTGTPSILLRTSTCNLRCRWIDKETGKFSLCDTPFTSWNPELDNEKSPEELYKEILIIARPKDDKDRRMYGFVFLPFLLWHQHSVWFVD